MFVRRSAASAAAYVALTAAAVLAALLAAGRGAGAQAPAAPPAPPDEPKQPELVTDRPDFTESAVVVPRRSVQVEGGVTVERTGGVVARHAGELLVRLGVARAAELRVGLNSYTSTLRTPGGGPHPHGLEDASVSVKLVLVSEARARGLVPTLGVLGGTTLATGTGDVRETALTPEAKLLAQWDLPAGWGLSGNLNASSARCDDPACTSTRPDGTVRVRRRRGEVVASLSADHPLGARLGGYAEVFGGRPAVGAGWQYANAGLTFAAAPLVQLDARVGRGLGGTRRDYFVGAGVSERF